MRSVLLFVTMVVLGAVPTLFAGAQSAEEHKAWMDDAGDLRDELAEELVAKSADKAAAAATGLAKILQQTEAYWAAKHADDIVAIARESRTLAAAIATAAKAGKFPEATETNTKLSARCNACHDLHPEKR
jgi:hypothetical protein